MTRKDTTLTAFVKKVLHTTEEVLIELLELPEYDDPSRNSGFVFLYDVDKGLTLAHHAIGDIDSRPGDKVRKYRAFSREKGMRVLLLHSNGHISSFESRDPENDKWAGGIWANDYVIAFSGLPEFADEALCLIVALSLGWISNEEAQRIADISSNPYFEPLKERVLG